MFGTIIFIEAGQRELMGLNTVGHAVANSPKRKSWLVLLWQTFRQSKEAEH